jgi:MFS family permease
VEVSPANRRAFYTSWVSNGIVSGFVLANLAFLPVALLPEDQLLSWGWRLPFWSSLIVMIVGYIIRSRLDETESFENAKANGQLAKLPVLALVRTHYVEILRVVLCTFALTINTVIAIFGLSYATGVAGIPKGTMLVITIATNAAALITQPLFGLLADRVGHRTVFIGGTLISAALTFAYFQAIAGGNIPLIALSAFSIISVFYAAVNAIYPAFFAEQFSLPVRTSGMAISQQIGQIVAGFAPMIATLIVGDDKKNWLPIACILAVLCIIAAIGAATSRETAGVPQDRLGAGH